MPCAALGAKLDEKSTENLQKLPSYCFWLAWGFLVLVLSSGFWVLSSEF
jgi:hypothetical protein